jgi:hypothetical protein
LGWRIVDSWGRDVMNDSLVGSPWKDRAGRGVRLSDVMVTGRQKVEGSELKRVKASCSSEETGRLLVVPIGDCMGYMDVSLTCNSGLHGDARSPVVVVGLFMRGGSGE